MYMYAFGYIDENHNKTDTWVVHQQRDCTAFTCLCCERSRSHSGRGRRQRIQSIVLARVARPPLAHAEALDTAIERAGTGGSTRCAACGTQGELVTARVTTSCTDGGHGHPMAASACCSMSIREQVLPLSVGNVPNARASGTIFKARTQKGVFTRGMALIKF